MAAPDTHGWNGYNYAGADTANLTDPNGMFFGIGCDFCARVASAVGGGLARAGSWAADHPLVIVGAVVAVGGIALTGGSLAIFLPLLAETAEGGASLETADLLVHASFALGLGPAQTIAGSYLAYQGR